MQTEYDSTEIDFINILKVKIVKCSYYFMWYRYKIGVVIDAIAEKKLQSQLLGGIPTERFAVKAIENCSGIKGMHCWLLKGDFEILGSRTMAIKA